jgi:hypothetical protein
MTSGCWGLVFEGGRMMVWEYRQWVVNTKGWVDLRLPEEYIDQLNHMSFKGWEVDQMVPIHTGISGTSAVVFLMKRKRNRVQS